MGRKTLHQKQRRAISDRLANFRKRHYETLSAMEGDANVAHSTACGWLTPDPSLPDTAPLVRIAERKNLNLNWLLLGEGEELRGVDSSADVWTQLRQTIVAELICHGASPFDAGALVPAEDDLFHWLMVEMLDGWMRAANRPHTHAHKIGDALGRALSEAEVAPAFRNATRPLPRARRPMI